jgi:hypothetical protein
VVMDEVRIVDLLAEMIPWTRDQQNARRGRNAAAWHAHKLLVPHDGDQDGPVARHHMAMPQIAFAGRPGGLPLRVCARQLNPCVRHAGRSRAPAAVPRRAASLSRAGGWLTLDIACFGRAGVAGVSGI